MSVSKKSNERSEASSARLRNPYIVGNPLVSEEGFFGRQDILRWVERSLRKSTNNSLVLYGQPRIGKTSILLQLQQRLSQGHFCPVYFELMEQASRRFGDLLSDLAEKIAQTAGFTPPPFSQGNDRADWFQNQFLPAWLGQLGSGQRAVLLFDEFDTLNYSEQPEMPPDAAARVFVPYVCRLMEVEPRLAFVFVVGRQIDDWPRNLRARFRASLSKEVWVLGKRDARNLIRTAERHGTLRFTDESVSRILTLTSGHPYFTQLLCYCLWDILHAKGAASCPVAECRDVDAAVPVALERGEHNFEWIWAGLSPAERIAGTAAAESAEECESVPRQEIEQALVHYAPRLNTPSVTAALGTLAKRRILIRKRNGSYRFAVQLLCIWLRSKKLSTIKDELNRIDPVANVDFKAGERENTEQIAGRRHINRISKESSIMNNPYIYGKPVSPAQFIDRSVELKTIFSRLRSGESTAVVGEPHIGKTSLLLKLQDPDTKRTYLGSAANQFQFRFVDLLDIGPGYTPFDFWSEILEPLDTQPFTAGAIRPYWEKAKSSGFGRLPMMGLFRALGQNKQCLVLLLDEFDSLLTHHGFQQADFFASLRSLATLSGGLAVITAGKSSVAAMNESIRAPLAAGSPRFNYMIEVRLLPFKERSVAEILGWADGHFDTADRHFIRRIAGRHPYLIQAAAAVMYEISETGQTRLATAGTRFYGRIAHHFDALWANLQDNVRTAAVILSLMELGGQAAGGQFAFGEIERVHKFGPELAHLEDLGLAERVGRLGWHFDTEHFLLWQGERWTIAPQAFTWWVRDVVIAGQRRVPAYEEWLADHRYRGVLTQEQWDTLVTVVKNLPGWAKRGVGTLARTLAEELLKKL